MLDYRLKVFRAVAEKLNFTRAAELLHISQPAVTQHIKALEEHYGTSLFRRAASGVTLTAAGQVLLAAVLRAATLEREVEAEVRGRRAALMGPLRLGASTTVAQYFLPAMLGPFLQLHPGIELTLHIGNTREVADGLRAARLELGLVEGPGERKDLQAQAFLDDELVCVAAPQHPLAKAGKVKAAALAETPFVQREPGSGTRDVVERALKKAGIALDQLNVVLETDSSEVIKGMVMNGAAVAFLSRLAVPAEIALGKLVIVPIEGLTVKREFYFLYPHGPRMAGPAGVFMDFVTERAGRK